MKTADSYYQLLAPAQLDAKSKSILALSLADMSKQIDESLKKAIPITYVEFLDAINNSTLIPQQQYLLTDLQTVRTILNTVSVNTGPIEPLILEAVSANKISGDARSVNYPQDLIRYTTDNINGSTKGCILKRIDISTDVDIPFDFRNVKFRRWKFNPTLWVAGSYNVNVVVGYNDKMYYSLNATTDTPGTGVNWVEIIGNTNLYLATSTSFPFNFPQFGGAVNLPIDANDYIDTVMFPEYASGNINRVKVNEGGTGSSDSMNVVVYTSGQNLAFSRNTFVSGSVGTIVATGNSYCYNNQFSLTNVILQIHRAAAANPNFAISFNKIDSMQLSIVNVGAMFFNHIKYAINVMIGCTNFTYNNIVRIQLSVLAGVMTVCNFNSHVIHTKYAANNINLTSCNFYCPLGIRYNNATIVNSLMLITASLYGKNVFGAGIGATWTPNIMTEIAARTVTYVDAFQISTIVTAPTPTSTGRQGEVRIVNGYIYFCTNTNVWVRHAVESTWV